MERKGFDNGLYISLQSEKINERINGFGGKLYLEIGGKLFDDYHAARTLPGFEPNSKIRMLEKLKDKVEIVITINSSDIEKSKKRGDLGITYEQEVMRLIDTFRGLGFYVGSIVLTQYRMQNSAERFMRTMTEKGETVYKHYPIQNYPADVELIVSDEGFGRNEYIQTTRPLVVITAPGPGSGKMATCLSQLYHEHKRGINAGYAKYETFPIWNIPLKHPVNLAYEAATADLDDVNMIDPYYLEAYGKTAVNYNRDIEIFPVLEEIMKRIFGSCPYKGPTDMGVNMAGFAITDDDAVSYAAKMEIVRRYYSSTCAVAAGKADKEETNKIKIIMNGAGIDTSFRECANYAHSIEQETGLPAVAIQLNDGHIVTGKTKKCLGASASAILNALKYLAGIDDSVDLISADVLVPVCELKTRCYRSVNPRLHTDEVLLALAICAATHENAALAMSKVNDLYGTDVHSSVILSEADKNIFRKLKMNLTCEPKYQKSGLYHA